MQHSDTLGELAKALAAAQAEIKPAVMNATNPFLKSKYADLGAVIDSARPVLPKHGLSYSQLPAGDGSKLGIETILMHSSGEWISSAIYLDAIEERGKSAAQLAGSIFTYLRRYALSAALGIYADEDTDAQAPAAPKVRPARAREVEAERPGDVDSGDPMTARTRGQMFALFAEQGIAESAQKAGIAKIVGHPVESRADLTEAQGLAVIAALRARPKPRPVPVDGPLIPEGAAQ